MTSRPGRGIDMAERREDAEFGGVADQDVEPAPAVEERRGEFVDLDEIAQVDRDEGGAAAGGANRVVDLFEAADRARRQHEMRALAREALGHRRADAARGAGDQRDLAGEACSAPSARKSLRVGALAASRHQRDDAEQRGEHQIIARRQAVAGHRDQPGRDERRKAAEDRHRDAVAERHADRRASRPGTARTSATAARRCSRP